MQLMVTQDIMLSAAKNICMSSLLMVILLLFLSTNIVSTAIQQQITVAQIDGKNSNFLTYENPTYRFKIQYPLNWEKVQFNQGIEEQRRNMVVNFLSPLAGSSPTFREYLIIEVGNLSSSPNRDLAQYITTLINFRQSLPHFNLIESNPTTLVGSNNPAYKIVYTYSNPIVGITKAMDILTNKGNNLYFLSYNADITKYSSYLPTIQKMIDSFEITG